MRQFVQQTTGEMSLFTDSQTFVLLVLVLVGLRYKDGSNKKVVSYF